LQQFQNSDKCSATLIFVQLRCATVEVYAGTGVVWRHFDYSRGDIQQYLFHHAGMIPDAGLYRKTMRVMTYCRIGIGCVSLCWRFSASCGKSNKEARVGAHYLKRSWSDPTVILKGCDGTEYMTRCLTGSDVYSKRTGRPVDSGFREGLSATLYRKALLIKGFEKDR
jgi:hypothetical protein